MKKVLIPPYAPLHKSEHGHYNFQYPSNKIIAFQRTVVAQELNWVGSKTHRALLLSDEDAKEIGCKVVWVEL